VQSKDAFEVFKLLEKSTCGNCGEKTCLAFAGAVFKGQRRLAECPRLERSVVAQYSDKIDCYVLAKFSAANSQLISLSKTAVT
jgi:CO dehydrogenase/acetyl-CoA synthase gamma subunit (corrinoid Fe-S protein)